MSGILKYHVLAEKCWIVNLNLLPAPLFSERSATDENGVGMFNFCPTKKFPCGFIDIQCTERLEILSFMRSTYIERQSKRIYLEFYFCQRKMFRILFPHISFLASMWIYFHLIPNFAIITEISKRTYKKFNFCFSVVVPILPRVQKKHAKIFDWNKSVVLGNIES